MNLEEIMRANGDAASELENALAPAQSGMSDDVSEILAELAQREDIDSEELEMIGNAAEELGEDFPPWLEDYMAKKGEEYGDEEGEPLLYEPPEAGGIE